MQRLGKTVTPLTVSKYIRRKYFRKSLNLFINQAIVGSNSYYLFHPGYPRIRISDHKVHPDSFNNEFIYIDIINDLGVFVNDKQVLIGDKKIIKYHGLIYERLALEIYLKLAHNNKYFLKLWHTRRKLPLFYKNPRLKKKGSLTP